MPCVFFFERNYKFVNYQQRYDQNAGLVLKFLDFSRKPNFLGSVFCYGDLFGVTISSIILSNCIVHVLIAINKYVASLFRISFCELLKVLILILLTMMRKLWCIVRVDKNLKTIKREKHHKQGVKKCSA